jgi:hypothetical protein
MVYAYNTQKQRYGNCILNINALTGHIISRTWDPSTLNKTVKIIDSDTRGVRFGPTLSCNGSGKVAVGCDVSYKETAGNGNDYYPSNRAVLVYSAQQGGPR